MPPTFIANASDELVPFQAAADLADNLAALPVPYQLCEVSTQGQEHLHGTQLLNPGVDCDNSEDSVFDNMLSFIADHLS